MKALAVFWLRATVALGAAVLLIAAVQQWHEGAGIPISGFWGTR